MECDPMKKKKKKLRKIKNKRGDWNLKFEIKVGPKTFETGERTVETAG